MSFARPGRVALTWDPPGSSIPRAGLRGWAQRGLRGPAWVVVEPGEIGSPAATSTSTSNRQAGQHVSVSLPLGRAPQDPTVSHRRGSDRPRGRAIPSSTPNRVGSAVERSLSGNLGRLGALPGEVGMVAGEARLRPRPVA